MEIEWDETCVRCGAKLPDGVRISREYCSRRCYMESYRALERQAVMEARANRPPCANCGGPIPMMRDMRAIYCSQDCNKGAQIKTCLHCGKEFRGASDRVHCSWLCYCQTAKRIHQPRPCQWCGVTITRPHAETRCCSWSCAGKLGMDKRLVKAGRLPALSGFRLDAMLEQMTMAA